MKERPILFSGPMVLAILGNRKTQTRRIVKDPGQFEIDDDGKFCFSHSPTCGGYCDYACAAAGEVLDGHIGWTPWGSNPERRPQLWVRESLHGVNDTTIDRGETMPVVAYSADGAHAWTKDKFREPWTWQRKNLPSIHMPRRLSRLTLEITGVRVERLHDITEEDAVAEGMEFKRLSNFPGVKGYHAPDGWIARTAIEAFRHAWGVINGEQSWDANPWVWVVTFKRVEPKGGAA